MLWQLFKKCKYNRNRTFFVFTILFDQSTRYLFFKNIHRKQKFIPGTYRVPET